MLFQSKKNKLLIEQKEAEKAFGQELAKAQIETHETTLRNISWELHDNIGQLITLAKIQIQNDHKKEDVKQVLDKVLNEVRALSKSLNSDALKRIRLTEAIRHEMSLFNRLEFLQAELKINGDEQKLDDNDALILFRILQEYFSNVIKHAGASKLVVSLDFRDNELHIFAKDNGKGFDMNSNDGKGIGLINMKNRAQLLGAEYALNSEIDKGTSLTIKHFIHNHEN
ncbi:sensor histidine kinase [Winogradskyella sp.]|uniref:sensor histidine kinase n=1 Tax=Winogradskyella sp. TaxID=1883156 RepID=UPI003BAD81DC